MKRDAFRSFLRPIDVRRHNRSAILQLLSRHAAQGFVVYDIGCGNMPFRSVISKLGCTYVGVDVEDGFYDERPDLGGTATEVPAPDECADIVISSQVLEHLERPLDALKEAHRLLKPGGLLFCSFPFLYPIHAPPRDYGRYSKFFMAGASAQLGLEIVAEDAMAGYWAARAMHFAIYLQSLDRAPVKYLGLVPAVTAVQQWFCLGMHSLEKLVLLLVGKNPEEFRQNWPVNYVFALRKCSADRQDQSTDD